MGFKDWMTSTADERKADFERREIERKAKYGTVFRDKSIPKPIKFEGAELEGDYLRYQGDTHLVRGLTAEFEHGAAKRGVTATRVAATGIVALAIKKDKTKVYITVTPDTRAPFIIEASSKHEHDARNFAAAINHAAAKFAD